jgi:hypothetical protein
MAAIPDQSGAFKEARSKGLQLKEDKSFATTPGYARKSHADSVITSQQVSSGPLMRESCAIDAS